MKNIFALDHKKASTEPAEMTSQQVNSLKSLTTELESLESLLVDNSDPWVISHLAKSINDIKDVIDFLKAKSHG